MPRKGGIPPRQVRPDPIYGSELVQRFINRMMLDGKKSVAERILYSAMGNLEKTTGNPGLDVFQKAIQNVTPVVEVRPRRVGGQTYQVPMDVRPARKRSLALRWIIDAARKRSGKSMVERLTAELLDAANGTGTAVKKKEDTHRMAEANKAFAHYRF
jgi:small subunit ribosomal protein S7